MFNLGRAGAAGGKTVVRAASHAGDPLNLHTMIMAELPLPASFKVLVAEDDPIQGMLLLTYLDRLGVDAVLVADGMQAVSAVQTGAFSLVLMDQAMPLLDGVQAAAAIRERERRRGRGHITIVALAAPAMTKDGERCLAAGADELLLKPISVRELCRVLLQYAASTEH